MLVGLSQQGAKRVGAPREGLKNRRGFKTGKNPLFYDFNGEMGLE